MLLEVPGGNKNKTGGGNQTIFTMAHRLHSVQMKDKENNSTSLAASHKDTKIKLFTVTFLLFSLKDIRASNRRKEIKILSLLNDIPSQHSH